MPTLLHGDCLDVLRARGGRPFDLVYLDPPYFLDREFALEQGSKVGFSGEWEGHEDALYATIAADAGAPRLGAYLAWLDARLRAIREHMAATASILVHLGPRESAYARLVLDRVFGLESWRATITWQRSHPHNNLKRSLGNVSDHILYYTRSRRFTFHLQHTPHDETYLSNCFSHADEVGEYALAPIVQERSRKGHRYTFRGVTPPHGWRVRRETLQAYDEAGRIHWGKNRAYKKVYLHEAKGAPLQTIWTDVANITRTQQDRRRWPTQKPLALLERIVRMSSNPGDLVLDPFCGSGTTLVAAARLGRDAVGIDASQEALAVARARLDSPEAALQEEPTPAARPAAPRRAGAG